MLARNFLTARRLGISERDRQAAITVLGMLERGEIKYVDVKYKTVRCSAGQVKKLIPNAGGLNIRIWQEISDTKNTAGGFCGCMGAWMEHVKGRSLGERCFVEFDDLFQPDGFMIKPEYFTPERCARALQGKLTTGEADWRE